MESEPPTDQQRSEIAARLETLSDAIQAHPQWKAPPNTNPTLFHIWDFVMRSKYMLSEYDNVKAGRPVAKPEQFKSSAGTGPEGSLRIFEDICSRTMMLDMLVNDTSGKAAMMTGGPHVDFGKPIKDGVAALLEACPQEAIMAGMMSE